MQAITVKVLPATNTKPTRLKATCQAGSKTVSYQYEGMTQEKQDLALNFADELGWLNGYKLVFGEVTNGDTVAVLVKENA